MLQPGDDSEAFVLFVSAFLPLFGFFVCVSAKQKDELDATRRLRLVERKLKKLASVLRHPCASSSRTPFEK